MREPRLYGRAIDVAEKFLAARGYRIVEREPEGGAQCLVCLIAEKDGKMVLVGVWAGSAMPRAPWSLTVDAGEIESFARSYTGSDSPEYSFAGVDIVSVARGRCFTFLHTDVIRCPQSDS